MYHKVIVLFDFYLVGKGHQGSLHFSSVIMVLLIEQPTVTPISPSCLGMDDILTIRITSVLSLQVQ